MTHPESLWQAVCKKLREQLNPDVYSRWISVISPKALLDDSLVLTVSNDFYQSWLEEHYLPLIKDLVTAMSGHAMKVILEVLPETATVQQTLFPEAGTTTKTGALKKPDKPGLTRVITLNPKYTFDTFVVGPSNSFAHASSLAVAQAPGKAYNPLFIYGGVGLGKTHLMQAIGHYALTRSKCNVCYLSCETLMNEYINSLQTKRVKQFRDKYRSTDLLLVDDIHFLAKTDALQEEFFHTFNVLYDAHKQIVMTSDRPANEISGLEQRLVSRFEWGQFTELILPDFETRIAILRFKQKSFNVVLPEDVLVFIAANICSNIRRLEGALIRLTSYASLYQKPVTVVLAEEILQSHLEQEKKAPVTLSTIQRCVAEYFDIRMSDMTSKQRSRGVAMPRQIAMYLCRRLTSASLPEIGLAFSKTHATALHSYRLIEKKFSTDQQLRQIISRLSKQLGKPSINAHI